MSDLKKKKLKGKTNKQKKGKASKNTSNPNITIYPSRLEWNAGEIILVISFMVVWNLQDLQGMPMSKGDFPGQPHQQSSRYTHHTIFISPQHC